MLEKVVLAPAKQSNIFVQHGICHAQYGVAKQLNIGL